MGGGAGVSGDQAGARAVAAGGKVRDTAPAQLRQGLAGPAELGLSPARVPA